MRIQTTMTAVVISYSDVFVYMATLVAVSAALYVMGSPTLLLDDTLINK